jgi:hypothetical protein
MVSKGAPTASHRLTYADLGISRRADAPTHERPGARVFEQILLAEQLLGVIVVTREISGRWRNGSSLGSTGQEHPTDEVVLPQLHRHVTLPADGAVPPTLAGDLS